MTKKLLLAFIFMLGFLDCVWSGNLDGNFWGGISEKEKNAYVAGVVDGKNAFYAALFVGTTDDTVKRYISVAASDYDIKGFDVAGIVGGINDFYTDNANKKIPMGEAFRIVLKRFRGESELKIQEEVEVLRAVSADRK